MGYLTDLFGNHAVDAINAYVRSDRPFLISLHFNAPHWPWEAPGDQVESERLRGKSPFDFDGGTQKTYQRMIRTMDLQIGRVLQALDANAMFPGGRTTDQVAISMDWLPTLLAAARLIPEQAYMPDGIDLLPVVTQDAPPIRRTLYWRYKANAQRAVRDGDYKYLKILDNTFLFNVVEDPMERANLKERHADLYDRLAARWSAWNATMLPEIDESQTDNFTGEQLADHIGTSKTSGKANNPASSGTPPAKPR